MLNEVIHVYVVSYRLSNLGTSSLAAKEAPILKASTALDRACRQVTLVLKACLSKVVATHAGRRKRYSKGYLKAIAHANNMDETKLRGPVPMPGLTCLHLCLHIKIRTHKSIRLSSIFNSPTLDSLLIACQRYLAHRIGYQSGRKTSLPRRQTRQSSCTCH